MIFQRKLPLKGRDSSPKFILPIVGNLQKIFVLSLRLYSGVASEKNAWGASAVKMLTASGFKDF